MPRPNWMSYCYRCFVSYVKINTCKPPKQVNTKQLPISFISILFSYLQKHKHCLHTSSNKTLVFTKFKVQERREPLEECCRRQGWMWKDKENHKVCQAALPCHMCDTRKVKAWLGGTSKSHRQCTLAYALIASILNEYLSILHHFTGAKTFYLGQQRSFKSKSDSSIYIHASSVGTQTNLDPPLFFSAFSRESLAVPLCMARPSADLSGASPTHTAGRKLTWSKRRALFVGPVKWSNSAKGSRHHCWSKEDDSWTQGWGQGHEGEGQGAKPSAFSWT